MKFLNVYAPSNMFPRLIYTYIHYAYVFFIYIMDQLLGRVCTPSSHVFHAPDIYTYTLYVYKLIHVYRHVHMHVCTCIHTSCIHAYIYHESSSCIHAYTYHQSMYTCIHIPSVMRMQPIKSCLCMPNIYVCITHMHTYIYASIYISRLCIHTRDTLKNQLRWGSLVHALSFACTMQSRVLSHALFGNAPLCIFFAHSFTFSFVRARTRARHLSRLLALSRALSLSRPLSRLLAVSCLLSHAPPHTHLCGPNLGLSQILRVSLEKDILQRFEIASSSIRLVVFGELAH